MLLGELITDDITGFVSFILQQLKRINICDQIYIVCRLCYCSLFTTTGQIQTMFNCVLYSKVQQSDFIEASFLQPLWHPQVPRWSINGPPSCQNKQTGRESPHDRLVQMGMDLAVLWYVGLKTDTIWPYKFFELKPLTTSWLPTTLYPPPL